MKYIYLFILLFFLHGCGKDGAVGPQGEKGEKGINGTNGNTIYSGVTPPSAGLGSNGDFYLNLSNGDLYGPKTNNSWGAKPYNMKGTPGAPGTPGTSGATILSGKSSPIISQGKIGDFYINLAEMTLYGPKITTGWGSPVSLKSDVENNVSVYLIKPDWSKNLITVNNGTNWTFTSLSDEYIVPGLPKDTYNVAYVAGAETNTYLHIDPSKNKWIEFDGASNPKYYVFPKIRVLEGFVATDVRIESTILYDTKGFKYKFSMSGKFSMQLASFQDAKIWFLIKSYKYQNLNAKNNINIERFLRVR